MRIDNKKKNASFPRFFFMIYFVISDNNRIFVPKILKINIIRKFIKP